MWDYIVLGQIPGTNLRLSFTAYLVLFCVVLAIYYLKKYHTNLLIKLAKTFKIYKPLKKLVSVGQDILGPKLKLIK